MMQAIIISSFILFLYCALQVVIGGKIVVHPGQTPCEKCAPDLVGNHKPANSSAQYDDCFCVHILSLV